MTEPPRCRRCGRCCCQKMILGEEVIYLPIFCEHYDPDTRLCTVYEHRYETNPQCLTVEEGIEIGVFPADCPYVRDIPGYVPPRERCTLDELQLYLEQTGRGRPGAAKPQPKGRGAGKS